ncbi:MAG: exodeoxyribonuclease VII large subunit, partial [Verrucomicrobiota bacterium]
LGERIERRVEEGIERRAEVLRYAGRRILTAGAEEVLREVIFRVDDLEARLERGVEGQLGEQGAGLRELAARWQANRPAAVLERQGERLAGLGKRLEQVLERELDWKEEAVKRVQALVKALGPESAFERGFSITMDEAGQVVRDAKAVKEGDLLETVMKGGVVTSRVE